MSESNFSRRKFLANAAAISAVGVIGVNALSSCAGPKKPEVVLNLPPLLELAPDGAPLKVGIIGCGGRGSGAMSDFLNAGPNLSVHALGETFLDNIPHVYPRLR